MKKAALSLAFLLCLSGLAFAGDAREFVYDPFIVLCANDGTAQEIRAAVKAGANVNAATYYGMTPLMYAVINHNAEVVRILLDAGAKVNAADDTGATPLMMVASSGDVDLIQILLDAGADITVRDNWDHDALHHAKKDTPAYALLRDVALAAGVDVDAPMSPRDFIALCKWGTAEEIRAAIDAGADVNGVYDDYGYTALMNAALNKYANEVRILLDAGANVNAATTSGVTALMLAASHGNPDVIQLLLDAGADISARDERGKTALDWDYVPRSRAYPLLRAAALAAGMSVEE
ncbi:hypothetical protein FACS1894130_11930 [Spirochaetia bacterium]|nr:hypothetical protein FACS1894130_11930 [Spirochaetia bacterium]